jgi:hypothetical protein
LVFLLVPLGDGPLSRIPFKRRESQLDAQPKTKDDTGRISGSHKENLTTGLRSRLIL